MISTGAKEENFQEKMMLALNIIENSRIKGPENIHLIKQQGFHQGPQCERFL